MGLFKCYIALLIALFVLAGCQETAPKYRWGSYEDHLHNTYVQSSNTAPQLAAQNFRRDINRTLEQGDIVPPGKYAHLGLLYYQINEINAAIEFLNKEKMNYPESSAFVDLLLKNVRVQQQ